MPGAELADEFPLLSIQNTVEKCVEFRPVVLVFQVAQFMDYDIVLQMLRKKYESHVEVYVPLGGA